MHQHLNRRTPHQSSKIVRSRSESVRPSIRQIRRSRIQIRQIRRTGEGMASSSGLSSLEQGLNVLGAFTILWLFLQIALVVGRGVRLYVLSEKWKGVDVASYGPWAVVTGATAGIGKAFAHELAKRGLNVVLISRSLDKLKQTAAEIEQQHGRSTRVIRTDFTGGSEIYEPIRAALEGLEIGILVNNVGITGFHIGPFLSFPNLDKYTNDAVNCNMLSAVKMTQMLLPQMVAREKGIIINVASVAGRRPWPFNLLYGVTKTFVDFFSQGLDAEYGPKGIKVQRLSPAEQMFEKIMATQEATKDRLGKIEEELMAVKKLEEAFLQVYTYEFVYRAAPVPEIIGVECVGLEWLALERMAVLLVGIARRFSGTGAKARCGRGDAKLTPRRCRHFQCGVPPGGIAIPAII
ncbi:very-long-chain 3-oxoacyl-CoA reductase-B-like [Sphaerodactylus townsendi]|uniref:very-long-chain 3-oxoacyl-CoA reductase-B-like n=1 Tax=Sphaerodactylus townsendi TaxID=933632 RepID=UPI002026B1EB|nr:very-long-chain 3-oxoacyl-CoA reductase-B-like [Sphaerodactylus townsendi]